jgi:hypothetical protein
MTSATEKYLFLVTDCPNRHRASAEIHILQYARAAKEWNAHVLLRGLRPKVPSDGKSDPEPKERRGTALDSPPR